MITNKYTKRGNVKVLTISDAHVSAGHVDAKNEMDRFKKLANFIRKNKLHYDYLVLNGDFADFMSLSSWDKNTSENVSADWLKDEIKSVNEALKIVSSFADKIIYIFGNHENRLKRYLRINTNLKSFNGDAEVMLNKYNLNIDFYQYKDIISINDVNFTHVPIQENGQPIVGINSSKKALEMFNNSVVYGDLHKLKVDHKREIDGSLHFSLCTGCFFESDRSWQKGSVNNNWKGVVALDIYKKGCFDMQTISLDRL